MKILVLGAGVLGSLYAGRLHQAGYDVRLLARSQRLADLREYDVVLQDARTGERTVDRVPLVETLGPDDCYDLALVVVRKSQLGAVLPTLSRNRRIPSFLFLVNNAAGPGELAAVLGRERVLLGFPGAGGTLEGHVVSYRVLAAWSQPTTVGELDGRDSPRLREVVRLLRRAGFPVVTCACMDAWLKTHVAVVSPVASALYAADGEISRLAYSREGRVLLVRAVREGFRVLRSLGIPITPARYRVLDWLPESLLVAILRPVLASHRAELVIARHANAARDEMAQLAAEFSTLVQKSGVPTPAIDRLGAYLDRGLPPLAGVRAG